VCGGSVRVNFGGLLRPYQPVWDDVDAQIQRWGALTLSLREMRRELEHLHIGALSLRTLNQRLHDLVHLDPERDWGDVPPMLQVDVIWVTQLHPNGKVRRDRKGRKRAVKGHFKCPVFVAMGVWPDSNRSEILLWQLGSSEDDEGWVTFLSILEEQGIRGENGLKLIIHDGGNGLCSALRTVYFGAQQQRCLFHKLRTSTRLSRCQSTSLPNKVVDIATLSSRTSTPSGRPGATTPFYVATGKSSASTGMSSPKRLLPCAETSD
jgi:hypothetical protein